MNWRKKDRIIAQARKDIAAELDAAHKHGMVDGATRPLYSGQPLEYFGFLSDDPLMPSLHTVYSSGYERGRRQRKAELELAAPAELATDEVAS